MTVWEAKQEAPDIDTLNSMLCVNCKANDWYCPTECDTLKKGRRLPFEKILKAYARHDGDLVKVARYIKETKEV